MAPGDEIDLFVNPPIWLVRMCAAKHSGMLIPHRWETRSVRRVFTLDLVELFYSNNYG